MQYVFLTIFVLMVLPFLFWVVVKKMHRYVFENVTYACQFVVRQAHEGDTIYLIEEIHNKGPFAAKRLMTSIHASRWLEFASASSVLVGLTRVVTSEFSLSAYEKIKRTWNLRCAKRGVYQIVNNTLTLYGPMGFSALSTAVPVHAKLIVFPEVVDLRQLTLSSNYFFGDTVVRRWIIDDPFFTAGAREYTHGDPMNRIHWTATAKHQEIMIRKNDFTATLDLFVLLNIQSMDHEVEDVVHKEIIEYGIKVVATVFDLALRNGARLRFACNAGTQEEQKSPVMTASGGSKQHVQKLLKVLSGLMLKNIRYFEEYLTKITQSLTDSEIIIVTAYINKEIGESIRGLIRARNNVKILVIDRHATVVGAPVGADIYYV